jgi:hypothetical protein
MCDPAKIFFHIQTETGTANSWGTTNSKPPGPIIMMGESETLSHNRSYLLHSFLQGQRVAAPFTSHCKVCNYAEPKLFF